MVPNDILLTYLSAEERQEFERISQKVLAIGANFLSDEDTLAEWARCRYRLRVLRENATLLHALSTYWGIGQDSP